jgi:hypothetical protein
MLVWGGWRWHREPQNRGVEGHYLTDSSSEFLGMGWGGGGLCGGGYLQGVDEIHKYMHALVGNQNILKTNVLRLHWDILFFVVYPSNESSGWYVKFERIKYIYRIITSLCMNIKL